MKTQVQVKTASDLKYLYEQSNPDGHFFDRKTMKFFGDRMKNYGVRKVRLQSENRPDEVFDGYELYRRKPVKDGLQTSAFFNEDGGQVHCVKQI